MHKSNNYQRRVWLLSGTGEGPGLAEAFLLRGWKVSVSVVSQQAASSYSGLFLDNLWIGAVGGIEEIQEILKQGSSFSERFDLVLDATHPFALQITHDLYVACAIFKQQMVRFERPLISPAWANYINDVQELSQYNLKEERILFAIGSRSLRDGVVAARKAGAIPFARIINTPESLKLALSSMLKDENLALLKPFQGNNVGEYESALCEKWSITSVICRQSGGITQKLWQEICEKHKINLWLVSRPKQIRGLNTIENVDKLLEIYADSLE